MLHGEGYAEAGMRKEVRLHVDKTTKLEGTFKAGDKVEAKATETDHALMIKHAQSAK